MGSSGEGEEGEGGVKPRDRKASMKFADGRQEWEFIEDEELRI